MSIDHLLTHWVKFDPSHNSDDKGQRSWDETRWCVEHTKQRFRVRELTTLDGKVCSCDSDDYKAFRETEKALIANCLDDLAVSAPTRVITPNIQALMRHTKRYDSYWAVGFENANDALRFKLTWGGQQ